MLLHSCYYGHFVHNPNGQWQEWLGTERVILPTWLWKLSSAESLFGEHSHGTQISSSFSVHIPLLQISLSSIFPIMFLLSPWPSSQNIGLRQCIHIDSYLWPFSPSKENEQPDALLHFPSPPPNSGRISLHYCPSGVSQKGTVLCSCLFVGGVCIFYSTICKSASAFSSSVNWSKVILYEVGCAAWRENVM